MTQVFDGKAYSLKIQQILKSEIDKDRQRGKELMLVSIQIGENRQSEMFLSLKKRYAEKIGVNMEIKKFTGNEKFEEILRFINEVNSDPRVNGVMIQMPISDNYNSIDKSALISAIDPDKDVDGMRSDSRFVAPVVKAVLAVLRELKFTGSIVGVVGVKGFVGRKVARELEKLGVNVMGVDLGDDLNSKLIDCGVVISATGKANVITGEMVKDGVVLIDVGVPIGDISQGALEKASFISPVPGGVGPLTISYLFENLVESSGRFSE